MVFLGVERGRCCFFLVFCLLWLKMSLARWFFGGSTNDRHGHQAFYVWSISKAMFHGF